MFLLQHWLICWHASLLGKGCRQQNKAYLKTRKSYIRAQVTGRLADPTDQTAVCCVLSLLFSISSVCEVHPQRGDEKTGRYGKVVRVQKTLGKGNTKINLQMRAELSWKDTDCLVETRLFRLGGPLCWEESNCQRVRFYCIALYCITLSCIIFITHLSVIITVYEYNLLLEIEIWLTVVNSYTGLKSRRSVKL